MLVFLQMGRLRPTKVRQLIWGLSSVAFFTKELFPGAKLLGTTDTRVILCKTSGLVRRREEPLPAPGPRHLPQSQSSTQNRFPTVTTVCPDTLCLCPSPHTVFLTNSEPNRLGTSLGDIFGLILLGNWNHTIMRKLNVSKIESFLRLKLWSFKKYTVYS